MPAQVKGNHTGTVPDGIGKEYGRFLYRPVLDFRITLGARNPTRRSLRQYRVEAGTDLFGVWVVEISYGRIGTAGRSRNYVFRDEGEAWHLAQSILKASGQRAATDRGRVRMALG